MIEIPAWSSAERELTTEQATALESAELADVLATNRLGIWTIRTGSKVGIVVGDGWELRIQPRLNVPRLMFLLSYAVDPNGWRTQQADFDKDDELFAAIAHGFSHHAVIALERGLLRGYVRHDELRNDIRGRVMFDRLIARGGLPLPAPVAYDEYTEDILENRILRTATQLLLRLPRVSADARRRLQRIRAILDTVTPLRQWRHVKAPPITRLNERYSAALHLAELVLTGATPSAQVGGVRSSTFVFDMNKVFEDFLTTAFREAMRGRGGEVRDQVNEIALDEAAVLRLRPDLSWWRDGRCASVLDAKYKAITAGVMRHPDAYQMLAYCTAYDLPRGYLVYARDQGEESRTHVIRNGGKHIIVTSIDVEREPDEVLAQVQRLADQVFAGVQPVVLAA